MKLLSTLLLFVRWTLFASSPDSTTTLKVNDTLPAVTLHSMDNKAFALREELKGKPLVIMFYRANWCPYCNAQLSDMQDIEKPLLKLGFKLIAISTESPTQLVETKEKNFLKMLLLSDISKTVIKVFGIANGTVAHPTVIVTDANHVIRYIFTDTDYTKRVSADTVYEVAEKVK